MIDPEWLTKTQAAEVLGVDGRTIERRARAGRITAKARPGYPTLYRAADVEMLRQTTAQEVHTGLLEAVPPAHGNGHGAIASLRPSASPYDGLFAEALQVIVQTLRPGPTGPTGPTPAPTGPTPAYVDRAKALAIAGVSYGALRQAVKAGDVKQRGRRYRRTDLEAL